MAGLTELHLCEFSQRPPALSWAAGNGVQEEAGGNVGRCPEGGGPSPSPHPTWTCESCVSKGHRALRPGGWGLEAPLQPCVSLLSPPPGSTVTPQCDSCTLLLNSQAPTQVPAQP